MKSIKILLIVLFFMMGSALITYLVYNEFHVLQVEEIKMNVTVANRVGFVLDADALHFGTTHPGGQSRRTVTIDNSDAFPIKVEIKSFGDLGPRLDVSENEFVLQPTEAKNITFLINAPDDVELNTTINGTVQVVFKRKFI